MEYIVERFDAMQFADEQIEELFSEGFPPFITADPVAEVYIERVFECFGKYHIALIDTTEDKPMASGWGRTDSLDGRGNGPAIRLYGHTKSSYA